MEKQAKTCRCEIFKKKDFVNLSTKIHLTLHYQLLPEITLGVKICIGKNVLAYSFNKQFDMVFW